VLLIDHEGMGTIYQLFIDHPLIALSAGMAFAVVTVLPFAGRRLPSLVLRMVRSAARFVMVPFSYWRRTVIDLASRAGGQKRPGATSLTESLAPIMQSILILGGILILTAGFLAGWRASGVMSEAGRVNAAPGSELPGLERTLAETRAKLAGLDREWEASRDCYRDEYLTGLYTEARRLSRENYVLGDFLSGDPQTKEVYSLLAGNFTTHRTQEEITVELRGTLSALHLPPSKEWMVNRYLDNLSSETELARGFGGLSDSAVRSARQPEYETLRRIEAEIPPAIAILRTDPAAAGTGPTFNPTAFASASWPSLLLFFGFVWLLGWLIEKMGSTVTLRDPARTSVNEDGAIKWAE
jgi:hypothetical protein